MTSPDRMNKAEDLRIIQQLQNRYLWIKAGLCCLGLVAGIYFILYRDPDLPKFSLLINATGGLLAIWSGYYFVRQLFFPSGGKTDILTCLREDPQSIVWVYHYIVVHRPFGIHFIRITTLYFNLINGERLGMIMPRKTAEHLMNLLRKRLPHCTFGHSDRKAFLYQANPGLLRK